MVPLEVGHADLGDQGVEPLEQVRRGLRVGHVEHQLAPPQPRRPVRGHEQPVRVLADQVGVGVDHLRLDPQPELHAQGPHPVGQRPQPLGPHLRVDVPVPQPRAVVTAPEEPAVVEDEPLHADPGGPLDQGREPVQVVVEVDRLPAVQHERARTPRMVRPGPEPPVHPRGRSVEAGVGPGAHDPRRRVALPGSQPDLSGLQQLAASDDGRATSPGALREPVREVHLVPAPGDVHAPDLTVAEAEPGRSRHHEQRGVVPGPAAARGAQPGAVVERLALRAALTAPLAGEVEQLVGHRGHREQHDQAVERVAAIGGVGEGVPHSQQPRRLQPQLAVDRQAGVVVHPPAGQPLAAVLVPDQLDLPHPVQSGEDEDTVPVPGEPRGTRTSRPPRQGPASAATARRGCWARPRDAGPRPGAGGRPRPDPRGRHPSAGPAAAPDRTTSSSTPTPAARSSTGVSVMSTFLVSPADGGDAVSPWWIPASARTRTASAGRRR